MKKAVALLVAALMIFGMSTTAFAQTITRGIKFNVVVCGEQKTFTIEEAIVADGASMFTVESYLNKFGCPGLTEESITAAGTPVSFEGKQYYSLRDVAAGCGLKVFWDSATRTTIVTEADTYDKVKELVEASNKNSEDVKRVAVEMNGKFDLQIAAEGEEQSFSVPLEAVIKMDLGAPYMEYEVKADMGGELGGEMSMKLYDDGENMYMSYGGPYFKSDSAVAQSVQMIEQMEQLNPATNALATELSIAALELTETEDSYVIEGDMYVAETFKGIDVNALMQEMYADTDMQMQMDLKYEWPDTVHVKYVMDKDGNIKEMYMIFGFGVEIGVEEMAMSFKLNAEVNIPKFEINAEFETTVPQEVLDNVVEE